MAEPGNRFQLKDQLSDVTLVVEDRELHLHRAVLMIHSPSFQKMLKASLWQMRVPLAGKKYSTMVALLEQIYPGTAIDLFKDETLAELLQLAHELDVQHVFHNCSQYITKRMDSKTIPFSTDHNLFYLTIVEKFSRLQTLRQELVDRASRLSLSELRKSKWYATVPLTAVKDILQKRLERIEADPHITEHLRKESPK
ncbi:uncharacterized protein LOC112574120 [Pomacea canaliculata]|uniref:uncharacterized protein LOC112574120 n=1 Tax=Pomacea canaliculata TaxID=400727 RepID=UPI000D736D3B|nr:uncharacterized protein LOC112574120 [Pomacea canaliculata]